MVKLCFDYLYIFLLEKEPVSEYELVHDEREAGARAGGVRHLFIVYSIIQHEQ